MRLLVESPNCNPHGGSNAAVGYGWATHLARDHDVHVVTYADVFDRGGATKPPFEVIRVPRGRYTKLGGRTDFLFEASRRRDELIDRIRPDVVHSIEPGGPGGPRALATTRVPYVLGPIAGRAIEPARGFNKEVLAALPVKPAKELFGRGAKRFALRMWNEALFGELPTTALLGRRAMRKAKAILLATSLPPKALRDDVRSKAHRVPLTGLDLTLFEPRRDKKGAAGPFTVLYAGRIVAIKCLHLLLEAAAKTGAHVRIAGSSPPEEAWYQLYCRERADALGIAGRVTWLGALAREDLVREYQAADVFCTLSLWDTYGLTYVEAMACGTPVIGLAAGGPAEVIAPGAGWLIQPTTVAGVVEQLAERLEALASDEALREEVGVAARAHAVATYGWDHILRLVAEVYAQVTAG